MQPPSRIHNERFRQGEGSAELFKRRRCVFFVRVILGLAAIYIQPQTANPVNYVLFSFFTGKRRAGKVTVKPGLGKLMAFRFNGFDAGGELLFYNTLFNSYCTIKASVGQH